LNLKSILSKDNVTRAGGVVASTFLTSLVFQRFSSSLPSYSNPYVRIAYSLAIPVAGAYVTRKFSPRLAEGMLLGGLATAIASLLNQTGVIGAVKGTSEYLDAPPVRQNLGGYIGKNTPGYSAVNAFSGVYDSSPAFPADAWSN
jgi:hypothetical protein